MSLGTLASSRRTWRALVLALGVAGATTACSKARVAAPVSPARSDRGQHVALDVMRLRYRVDLGRVRKSPDPHQYASVAIDHRKDRFYSAGTTGRLCSRDLETGRPFWCTRLGGEHRGEPLLTPQGDLLISQDNGELRWFDHQDLEKGGDIKPRWRFASPGVVHNPPVVAGGFVFLASSRNQVIALDERSGKWRWTFEREMPKEFSIFGRAGVIYRAEPGDAGGGGVLFTGFDDGQVAAIDALTGQARWIVSLAPPGQSELADVDTTPIWFDAKGQHPDMIVVAGAASGIHALSPRDGSILWKVPATGVSAVTQIDEDRFLAVSATQGLWALNRHGQVLWTRAFDHGSVTQPTVYRDLAFVGHDTLGLMTFDLATGELLALVDLHSGSLSRPQVATRRAMLLTLTHYGWLMAYDLTLDGASSALAARPLESSGPMRASREASSASSSKSRASQAR